MTIVLNHTIVPARDKVAAARFFADIFGLPFDARSGHFAPVGSWGFSSNRDCRGQKPVVCKNALLREPVLPPLGSNNICEVSPPPSHPIPKKFTK